MPIHASVSGKVTAVKKVWHASGRMVDALEIENDHLNALDDAIRPEADPTIFTRAELVQKMQNAGLSGLGGAGFHLCEVSGEDADRRGHHQRRRVRTLHHLRLRDDREVSGKTPEGAQIPDARRRREARRRLLQGLQRRDRRSAQAVPFGYPNITLHPVKDLYPAGWEKYLVQQVTGKSYPNLPAEAGAIVDNSGTAIVYADVVEHNIPLISRAITISGEGVKEPKNFLVPIGTPVKELVALCGGYRGRSRSGQVVLHRRRSDDRPRRS
ncbi:MAG: SLBB domain-containing protein [Candidatus Moduliflexus flocculans]|nr:SLBB domain-containing protein [Candidatus Moduliflexus flocculans]